MDTNNASLAEGAKAQQGYSCHNMLFARANNKASQYQELTIAPLKEQKSRRYRA